MRCPFVVVGAGIAGITVAERLATLTGQKVLILERRAHIGGNLYDRYNENGILVHEYGPHIVHTDDEDVWRYLSRFTGWRLLQIRVKAYIDGKYVSVPINLKTMRELYGLDFTPLEMQAHFGKFGPPAETEDAEEYLVSRIGRDLFSKIYEHYILKQWDTTTRDLDVSVVQRLPIRFDEDDRYFTDRYQGIPVQGYHRMFEAMIANEKISVLLNTDYESIAGDLKCDHMFYSGPIDCFHGYAHGELQYRGLVFVRETLPSRGYLAPTIAVYPGDHDYTRVTDYGRLTTTAGEVTTVVREYPAWNGSEYYPVLTERNRQILRRYRDEALPPWVTLVGRLAEYRYYNIDQVVSRALTVARQWCTTHGIPWSEDGGQRP